MSVTLTERLREVAPTFLRSQPVTLAYLYGSRTTGRATALSDVDVAIVTTSSLPARERLRLELTLETQLGSALGGDFDVRVINNAPLVVQGTVVQTGTLLYARDERTRVDFETRVRDRYFDFLPVLLFHRDAYLSAQRASLLERTAP